jgi:hypothetical protein
MEIVMRAPDCHDHGRLVLELALGRLEDNEADRAEAVRCHCPTCSEWWATTFDCEQAAAVHNQVSDVFRSLELPRRSRFHPWWAAAAAAAVVACVVGLWTIGPGLDSGVTYHANGEVAPVDEVIAVFDFESGTVAELGTVVENGSPEPVFAADFESGSLGDLVPHT